MDIGSASATLCIVLVTILTIWAYRLINWLWLKPVKLERCLRQQGLPGSSYRLFFGDAKDESRMHLDTMSKPLNPSNDLVSRLLPFASQHAKKYGGTCFAWVGPKPRLFVVEPKLIHEVFTRIEYFHKPPYDSLDKMLASGVVRYNDGKWAKHRKLLTPPFHLQKLKNMVAAFCYCTSEIISKWEKLLSRDESVELDVWPDMRDVVKDGISRTAFGSSFENGKRMFDLQKEMVKILIQVGVIARMPGYRLFQTRAYRRMIAMEKEIRDMLRAVIDKKEKAMEAGTATSDDLLGTLVESNLNEMKEHQNDKSVGMTIDDVIEECKLFYFAGQETTAPLLVWTLILLSQHKEWQVRAREEVRQVLGDEKPHMEGLNQLKILNMILREVLRLYPSVSMIDRETYKETKLGNFTLPAGVRVSIPVLLIHHDPQIWGKDAHEFKPERFSEGVSKASNGQVAFLPFGWGPRICLGMNFALLEAKVAIAMILQKFSFEVSPSYTHAPSSLITTQPLYGAHLILHKL